MPRIDDLLASWKRHPENGRSKLFESNGRDAAAEEGCPLCGGCGFVRRDVPMGHRDFAQALPCRCVQQESSESRQSRLVRYSNLGPLTRLTFDTLIRRGRSADQQDQRRFQRCVDDAEAFAKDPHGWLVFVGASGCGKTHVAAAIANRCIELGTPALFVVVPDLLDHLRAAYKPDAEVAYDQLFEQVRNAPVLVLDDLGTQSATAWAQEKLFQIINERFNARMPTVVTTSSDLRDFDERLRMRLGDPSLPQPHADVISTVYVLEERRTLEDAGVNMLDLPMVREMTFESFDLKDVRSQRDSEWRENAFRQALRFAEQPDRWMILLGGRIRDRTHLIAAIGNYRRRLGEAPLLVNVADLLDFLRHAMFDETADDYELKQSLRRCPLLLVDDLEIGMGSDHSRRQLYQLLNSRYLARLPTVISSPNQLNQLLSDDGWMRLAQLFRHPAFCSEVPVGETPPEEEAHAPRPASARGKRSTARGK